MSRFLFTAVDEHGQRVEGEMDAATQTDAVRILANRRLQPVSVKAGHAHGTKTLTSKSKKGGAQAATKSGPSRSPSSLVRMSAAQVILFTEEIADLLEAGLPLESCLRVVENRKQSGALKQVATAIRQRLRDGSTLATALRESSPSFGELYCNLVAAGETGGALTEILRRQATHLNTMADLKRKVSQALVYPAFIFAAGVGLLILFMTVLVPNLVRLFEKTDRALPLATKLLIGFSTFVGQNWWWLLGALLGALAGSWAALSTQGGRSWWDATHIRLPLVGAVFEYKWLSQFAQTLANLVGNGLPLLDGLRLMERATANLYFKNAVHELVLQVADGVAFASALRRVGGFPPLFVDLIGVGEQTGDLATSLDRTAKRYEKEMNARITLVTALIQPTIIVAISLIILSLVYGIITSIFELTSTMRTRGI